MPPDNSILEVIGNGYCIGCGVCAIPADSPFVIEETEFGAYRARARFDMDRSELDLSRFSSVCPFADTCPSETTLGSQRFPSSRRSDPIIGAYARLYAGSVSEGSYRADGSSGGFGSWAQAELLRQGLVDHVIHVREAASGSSTLFEYTTASTTEEVQRGAKSKYYPIELSGVLAAVKENAGTYALIGVPCFLKAAQALAIIEPLIETRIRFYIGLVCGHLKTKRFAEALGWQMDVHPDELSSFDFRTKTASRPASQYAVSAFKASAAGDTLCRQSPVRALVGSDWGHGMFKYKACDYCDDVFAETADLTIGDAWLPRFNKDPQGTNLLVVRSDVLAALIEQARLDGRVSLVPISTRATRQSQAAGIRHKRSALQHRLHCQDQQGRWRPAKRVAAKMLPVDSPAARQCATRELIRDASHLAFQEARLRNDLSIFISQMASLIAKLPERSSTLPKRTRKALLRCLKMAGRLIRPTP